MTTTCYVLTAAACITLDEQFAVIKNYYTEFLTILAFQKLPTW